MAQAGFWAIESNTIRFGRDGNWYSDDEPIVNPRIARLFSQHVTRGDDGEWWLVIGDERARIVVDDTPFVIHRVDGSPTDGFSIELNDGTTEALPAGSLEVSAQDVLYCSVKDGAFRARFLRAAQAELLSHTKEIDGAFVLPLPDGQSARLAAITLD
ncbi:MAG: DUF1285 domain-containing protein [Candidatus Binatia bacterium]|nr:DUF1285 domain-containing protein [Candidatus Binatia bacterium]